MAAGYRIKTWRHWEVMEQKLPGEWDAAYPEKGTIDDQVNAWLADNNVEPSRVGYSCMPVGIDKATGRTTYLHTLVITYIPQEHVHDARNQTPQVAATQEAAPVFAAQSEAADSEFVEQPPADSIRVDGPADLERIARLINLPASEVHRLYAQAAGGANQLSRAHVGVPVPDGPHRGGQPGGGHPAAPPARRPPGS